MKQYQLKAERLHLTSSRRSYRPVVIFAATVEPQSPRTSQLFGDAARRCQRKRCRQRSSKRLKRTGDFGSGRTSSIYLKHTHPRQAHKSSAVKWRKMSDRAIRMACWSRSEVRNISNSKEVNGGGIGILGLERELRGEQGRRRHLSWSYNAYT